MKIAVCDDNELQIDLLVDILEDYLRERNIDASISKFYSGEELITTVKGNGCFDLYILDLIMPGINGFEVASTLRMIKDNGIIIFLTSTVEYAVMSYDVDAYYYLLKPLEVAKLNKILDGAINEIKGLSRDVLMINAHSSDVRIPVEDIMFINIIDRCPTYHLKDGREVRDKVLRGSFKEAVKKVLEHSSFSECGVGMIINDKYVDAIDSDSVLLRDGTLLYPSKSGLTELKRKIKRMN